MTAGRRLANRVALVTGAARGIGLAAAEQLAREGARVLMSDIDADVLHPEAGRLAGDGHVVAAQTADVADPASVEAMVARAVALWGRLDILVNNAAIPDDTPLDDLTPDRWRYVLGVNLDSVLYCVKAAEPPLKEIGR